MRSGDGIESSYVSVESEIGFLWKVGCREKINRQSGAADGKHVLLRWPEESHPKESCKLVT